MKLFWSILSIPEKWTYHHDHQHLFPEFKKKKRRYKINWNLRPTAHPHLALIFFVSPLRRQVNLGTAAVTTTAVARKSGLAYQICRSASSCVSVITPGPSLTLFLPQPPRASFLLIDPRHRRRGESDPPGVRGQRGEERKWERGGLDWAGWKARVGGRVKCWEVSRKEI